MYTTEQAIALAQEVDEHLPSEIPHDELTAYANLIRDMTLLEAAEMFRAAQMDDAVFMLVAYRMAGEE